MKEKFLVDLLKEDNIVVPLSFYKCYKKLDISLDEFFFFIYLKGKGNLITFNPVRISEDLGLKTVEVLTLISSLNDKKLLVIDTYKNDKGTIEEKINLSLFYEKITSIMLDEVVDDNVNNELDENVFSIIEKEFGRTLNSSEIEFIKAWASNFNNEVIIEAVKEASLNGVSSIRYIDRILYEWDKKGIKTKEDVIHFLNKKSKELNEPIEVFDYDWFDDDEERE